MYQEMINKLTEHFPDNNEVLLNDMQSRSIDTSDIGDVTGLYDQIRVAIGYLVADNNFSLMFPETINNYIELILGNANDRYSIIGQAFIELESIPCEPYYVALNGAVWNFFGEESGYLSGGN